MDGELSPTKSSVSSNTYLSGSSDFATQVVAIRKKLVDGATGPLFASIDVMKLVNSWELYETEAGGLSAKEWTKERLGRPIYWFEHRKAAVDFLGRDVARNLDHDFAVWVSNTMKPEGDRRAAVFEYLVRKAKELNRPVSQSADVETQVRQLCGKPKKRPEHVCAATVQWEDAKAFLESKRLMGQFLSWQKRKSDLDEV